MEDFNQTYNNLNSVISKFSPEPSSDRLSYLSKYYKYVGIFVSITLSLMLIKPTWVMKYNKQTGKVSYNTAKLTFTIVILTAIAILVYTRISKR